MFSRLRSPHFLLLLLLLLSLSLALGACAAEVVSRDPDTGSGSAEVLAIIDGEPITVADLDVEVADQLAKLEFEYGSERYQLLREGLEQAVREHLLEAAAVAQGLSAEEFVEQELADKIDVTEAEVTAWHEANKARLSGRSLETMRPAVREFLLEQERERLLGELSDRLAADHSVKMNLDPFRAEIDLSGHPALGPEDAPVTLVEFSDFECPYCGSFLGTIERVKSEYEGRIQLVYRQFPLRQIHPNADRAAQASLCAQEQERFWEFHDLMFAEQRALAVADLKDKAARTGLDVEAFATCLDSGRYADRVQNDLNAGARLGVTGTPALFVNGRPIEGGAVPFETIAKVIDEELERARR